MKDFDSLKIAVAGTGYVGLSLATLLGAASSGYRGGYCSGEGRHDQRP